MEAPSSGGWSELPVDILRYLLERLSFFDFHRAAIVCSNWYLCSKQTLRLKFRSPLLMLCPEEGGCRLSGYQFLGNSGKWFLVVDSRSDLYIIDVFSHKRMLLPRLETLKGGPHEIQGVGENEFKENLIKRCTLFAWDHFTIKDLRVGMDVRRELRGLDDMVLKVNHKFPMSIPIADERAMYAYKPISVGEHIVVPTSGEPLFLYTRAYEPTSGRPRIFRLYKRDAKDLEPNTFLVEVDSLGDVALFVDLGITVPADRTLGIEPNSIYFTRDDRLFNHTKRSTPCIDVCVYNLATKTIKPFASLSNFKPNDAMWFLPS
ncbi:hypothetical protein Bca4012_052918 [Brassica carinata]